MASLSDLSIVIPYREGGPGGKWRQKTFEWTLARYEFILPECPVVIGEMGEGTFFRRSEAINNGVLRANTEFVMIADVDVTASRSGVTDALRALLQHPEYARVFPYDNYHHLTMAATERRLRSATAVLDFNNKRGAGDVHESYPNSTSGLMVMSRHTFWNAGGFDERFQAWGPEDRCFDEALATLCGPSIRVDTCDLYHLWHPIDVDHRSANPHYEAGMALWEQYKAASGSELVMRALIEEGGLHRVVR